VQAAVVYRSEGEREVGRSVGRLAESGDGQFECYAGQMLRMANDSLEKRYRSYCVLEVQEKQRRTVRQQSCYQSCRRPWLMSGARAIRGVRNGGSFCVVVALSFS
jgi:hypothetical protein